MENIQYLSLDIMNNHIFEYAYSKQYDEGRTLIFTVTENGLPYDLTGVIATFQMKKPDNTIILDSGIIEDNKIKINVTSQMTILQGKIPYQIQLLKDKTIITTVTGFFKVDKSVVDPDDVISSDEFNALNDALKKVNADYTYVMESAQASADDAKKSQIASKTSEENAKISEENAAQSSSNANGYEKNAKTYSESANRANLAAMESSNNATYQATQASNFATKSQSYAIGGTGSRENEDVDNSKYYYEQAKGISESFSGALRPMGTVTFANLPTSANANEGDMYNISDEFTTNSTFKEGSGYTYPAGTNVYKTMDGYWDCLAGTLVTGIKGDAETSYRKGNINLTAKNVGALPLSGGKIKGDVNLSGNLYLDYESEIHIDENELMLMNEFGDEYLGSLPQVYLKKNDLFNLIYPIGSIYMSVSNVNPSTLFGGTWVAWGSGRVPVGVDANNTNFNTVEKTGGANTVTLTEAQMPKHHHDKGTLSASNNGAHAHTATTSINYAGSHNHAVYYYNNAVITGSKGYLLGTTSTNSGKRTSSMDNAGNHNHTATTTMNSDGVHNHPVTGTTSDTGSGQAHNNLQPYITCYMWKRTA